MSKEKKEKEALEIPESLQESAKNIITDSFRLFSKHTEELADELAEFNRKRQETRRRIQVGAKRTSGHIV